jgi:hypothetical protein
MAISQMPLWKIKKYFIDKKILLVKNKTPNYQKSYWRIDNQTY